MAIPVFASNGGFNTNDTDQNLPLDLTVPSGVTAGDIIIVTIIIIHPTKRVISHMPTGFMHAYNSPLDIPFGGVFTQLASLNILWKRATGNDTGTYEFAFSGQTYADGYALRYTGASTFAVPFDNSSVGDTPTAFSTTNVTDSPAVQMTTLGPNRLKLFVVYNLEGGSFTAPSSDGPWTERSGSGSVETKFYEAPMATTDSTGFISAHNNVADSMGGWIGALIGTDPSVSDVGWLST